MNATDPKSGVVSPLSLLKLIAYSCIGLFVFFIPINIGGKETIPLDHIVSWLRNDYGQMAEVYAILVVLAGGAYPFISGNWRASKTQTVLSIFKVLGVVTAVMAFFSVGPAFLFEKDMLPFLFSKLVVPVGLIVPIGAVFLAFLIGYGLLEFAGVLLQPIMKPLFKTPGKSAIDAVASFVGSYSIGLLITNRVYKSGQYSAKEAAIIATGFSTVSATFMVIVAKTLGLMDVWNVFFWATLLITFVVTAITVRIFPLSKMDDTAESREVEKFEHSRFKQAALEGLDVAKNAAPIGRNILQNIKEGMLMAMSILPSIMSVGLCGLLLAKYTPVFEWIGYLFYPFAWIAQLPDPMMVATASATGLAEMFLPALIAAKSVFVVKFVVGVVSISSILFFSASIPCILSTEIPLNIKQMLMVWYQRVALTILIASPVAFWAEQFVQ
ncbi:histidine transporter [Marinomonas sp. A3A]|jgi:nucleoside recognition membrane protein YjiH|uniref:YjiH family protein n=1 Tax=Marinomonas sp. A3A TaxID=2065312 RepID=UPI001BB3BD9A|nr:YjiH family protein [Marinomonas sp. A3A]QUX92056.1 histidine transporter [Marinomonas sp. A3A]